MNITGLWDQLVDCICRPPRDKYTTVDLPGGVAGTFKLKGKEYLRKDIQLENSQKQHIKCSHLVPKYPPKSKEGKLPCVVYCHCNSGSRRDSEEALHLLLPQNITVFSLDFVGSGQSDGKYVTLGWREQDDLALAIQHLRGLGTVSYIGLWGRSMGAVTALLYSQKDPSIAGVVVDSPFSKLTELMLELVEEQKIPIPRSLMRVALSMMRRSVKKRAGFNIDEVAPIDQIQSSFIPVLFGHAEGDTFVAPVHSEKLLARYGSDDKRLIRFKGDHNSIRPAVFYTEVLMYFHRSLRCEDVLIPDEQNPGQFELHSDDAARVAENMDTPALSRTSTSLWGEVPSYTGDAEQMEEYLTDELTNQMAWNGINGNGDLPSQQGPMDSNADESHAVPNRLQLRQQGQPTQILTEEAALARALQLSLMDIQHQEHGHVPGNGAEPAAAASTALQDTVPQDMQGMAPEDAEEAMLAAAIRASLIEAGEPDTRLQAEPATTQQPGSSHKQQQESLPVSVSAASAQERQLISLSNQQQQTKKQQQEEQGLPNGHGQSAPSAFSAAAWQFGGMPSALQDTGSSMSTGQGVSELVYGHAGIAQFQGQMRPSWSSNALLQDCEQDADGIVSASSTPAGGLLHERQQAASHGHNSGAQHQGAEEAEYQLHSSEVSQHEQSPLLARPYSMTSMSSSQAGSAHQQLDASGEHGFMRSPLYTDKDDSKQSSDGPQSAVPAVVQQNSSPSQTDQSKEFSSAQNAQNDSIKPSQQDPIGREPSSPSKYPDTCLYQFADIELAHGHQ